MKTINNFREIANEKTLIKRAKKISRSYINDNSDLELNINTKTKQEVLDMIKINNFSVNMFDKAQKEVVNMISDTLLRFYSSEEFNNFISKKDQRKLSIQENFTNFITSFSDRRSSITTIGEAKQLEVPKKKKFSFDIHKIFRCSQNMVDDEFQDPEIICEEYSVTKKKSIDMDPVFIIETNQIGEKN